MDFIAEYGWLASLVNLAIEEPVIVSVDKSSNLEHNDELTLLEEISFPFLSLPPEIRNRIYEYALTVDHSPKRPWIKISHHTPRSRLHVNSRLAILETCRQVSREAWHFFYQRNTLCLASATHLFCFLDDVGAARRNQIRSIRCDFDLTADEAGPMPAQLVRRKLRECKRLEELSFVMTDERQGHGHRPFKKFWGLKKVRIERKGGGQNFRNVERAIIHTYESCLTKPRPEETQRFDVFEATEREEYFADDRWRRDGFKGFKSTVKWRPSGTENGLGLLRLFEEAEEPA